MMEMNATPSYHINTTDVSGNNNVYFYQYANLARSLHIMFLVVISLAFVIGLIGNGMVIWLTGFKMKKTVNTVWFLNLAVADFLFTAFLPARVTYQALDRHWPFSKFMCKLNSALTHLNIFTSVYILAVISVDRCVSVVWPVWAQNHRSVRKAVFVSLCVWVLALIFSVPYFIFRDAASEWYQGKEYITCFNNFDLSDDSEKLSELAQFRLKSMAITLFLLGFVVPFTVIVSCYAVIIHRLRRNRTLTSQSSRPFKIIAAVITTFFLCWAPFHIMALIEVVHYTTNHANELTAFLTIGIPIASSLTFLNSCLNPVLYVLMGQNFKDQVHKTILKVLETTFQ